MKIVLSRDKKTASDFVMSLVKNNVASGKKCFLIVPESAALTTEMNYFSALPASANFFFEVLTFKRLPNRVHRALGGIKSESVSDMGKLIATARALRESSANLEIYGKLAQSESFIKEIAKCITGLKASGFSPDDIEKASETAKEGKMPALASKLSDISVIYGAYEALLHNTFNLADSEDRGNYVEKKLSECGKEFFNDTTVFLDGFSGFTSAQYKIVESIAASADDTVVTLPCEYKEAGEYFEKPKNTLNALKQIGEKYSNTVSIESKLPHTAKKYKSLEIIRSSLWDDFDRKSDTHDEGVELYKCDTKYGEAEAAAMLVMDLTEKGYKTSDIILCAEDPTEYAGIADTVFAHHGVPLHLSVKTDFSALPLYRLMAASLAAIQSGNKYKCEDMLAVLKSSLSNVEEGDLADNLEIYARTWNISGAMWNPSVEFTSNPDGFDVNGISSRGAKILEDANKAKTLLARPLYNLSDKLSNASTAKEFGAAIYEYAEELNIYAKLNAEADLCDKNGDGKLADLKRQLFDAFTNCLDICVKLCEDSNCSLSEFTYYFLLALKSSRLATIPSYIDDVQFLPASQCFGYFPKVVIVLGANDSVFPRTANTNTFFTKKELASFEQIGLDLGADKNPYDYEPIREFYDVCSLPSDKLIMLCDKNKEPSFGFSRIEALLSIKAKPSEGIKLYGKEALADAFALSGDEEIGKRLFETDKALYETVLKKLSLTNERISKETVKMKYPEGFEISPSTVERFSNCKLSAWISIILGLREEKSAKIEGNLLGTYVHFILENFVKDITEKGIKFADVNPDDIDGYIDAFSRKFAEMTFSGFDNERFIYLVNRAKRSLRKFMENMLCEFSQSEFVPLHTEYKIGKSGEIKGLTVKLDSGDTLSIRGSVDRVDKFTKQDGTVYVRVADYKRGGKKFVLEDVKKGLNLQMLLYLFSICEAENYKPAGVLYYAIKPNVGNAEYHVGNENSDTLLSFFKPSGLLVEDEEVLRAMDKMLEGRFIPYKASKPGKSSANAEEFDSIKNDATEVLISIGNDIKNGIADGIPCTDDACKYCKLSALCRFEKGDYAASESDEESSDD